MLVYVSHVDGYTQKSEKSLIPLMVGHDGLSSPINLVHCRPPTRRTAVLYSQAFRHMGEHL